jgi:hypothetical protein
VMNRLKYIVTPGTRDFYDATNSNQQEQANFFYETNPKSDVSLSLVVTATSMFGINNSTSNRDNLNNIHHYMSIKKGAISRESRHSDESWACNLVVDGG